MASLFSVSRLIGKGRTRSSKRLKDTPQENEGSQSQKRVVVDSASSVMTAAVPVEDETSKVNSRPETSPKEQDISFPPTPSHKSEVSKTHERKAGSLEEPGYDLVLQPSAKASFGEWTELDAGSGPAAKAFDAENSQFSVDINTKEEQSLVKTSNSTNWTPLDVDEKAEELPRMPSVPDWTQLEIDKKEEEPSIKPPSDAEWLQLDMVKKMKEEKCVTVLSVEDNGGITSETRVKEERVAYLEEICTVREEKEKLVERVKELEAGLHQAEHELQLKMEQISKFVVDLDQKEEEIEALKEEKEHIRQVAAREKEESLDEIRQSNDARWQVAKELKDTENVGLLAKQADMQDELDVVKWELSESRARVAELESANELQAKKFLEQDAVSASRNDAIVVLKRQKADLITQVHTLRTNVKVNQRQNSMLMVQLKQQSDDLVAAKGTGTIPNFAKSIRRTTGPTLVEQAVRTIKALNDEIYQTAASLTDCVDEIEKRFVDESDGTAAAVETLKSLLGTEIYAELEEQSCYVKENYNPFVLQTGFQVCLTACCMRIITSWYPAELEYGKFLEAVYERIRGYGKLSVSTGLGKLEL